MEAGLILADIVAAIAGKAFRFVTEDDLQRGIEAALVEAGIAHEREVRLGPKDRIDFLAGDVGLEVKIGGSLQDLTRQLFRYSKHEQIAELVLVTSHYRLGNLPSEIGGKPLTIVTLPRAFA